MPNPDALVAAKGRPATLSRVTAPVYDDHDVLDLDASTIETPSIKVVLSNPSEEDEKILAGRESRLRYRATVNSALDVSADREGREDRVLIDGQEYRVMRVADDKHLFTGIRKKTLLLEQVHQGG